MSESDRKKIPQSFDFIENGSVLRMWLNYRGKPRRCHFCAEFHDSVCEQETLIRQLEKERDDIKAQNAGVSPIKTYTDSTLRLVQQRSLAGDVDAMSGASTGNLINAIDVDPDNKCNTILIVGGQNELHRKMSNEEFVHVVQQKERHVIELSDSRRVVLLAPPLQNFVDANSLSKEEYFHQSLKDLNSHDNITVLDNPLEVFEDDDGRHPTSGQTVDILKFLHSKLEDDLGVKYLLPSATDESMVTKTYFGVTPLYRFGCSGCKRRKKNKWANLCDDCVTSVQESSDAKEAAEKIEKRAEELFNLNNPPLNVDSDTESLTCECCDVHFSSGSEIRDHFNVQHPEIEFVMPSVRDKCKYQDGATKQSRRNAVFKNNK